MSIRELLAAALLGAAALSVGWIWHENSVAAAYQDGWGAAVTAGEKQRGLDAAAALKNERTLRTQLAEADAAAVNMENENAETLAAAQRRIRAGDDSLRIAVRTLRASATPPAGPAAGESAPDNLGAAIVPEVAGDILGLAADTGRVLRKYERVVERLDTCIALNNQAVSN
jgi:hypothetical protein